ncbi:MAG: hypothetical protein V2I56_05820, partial [Desulfobacteraceae bacterium]|nr:hypothetical protein [Desulfobacteraceae bacterium]
MEKAQYKSALVRILMTESIESDDGHAVGAGFLISSKHIITCAHVIEDVLGTGSDTIGLKNETVYIDFPLLGYYKYYKTTILGWYPVK